LSGIVFSPPKAVLTAKLALLGCVPKVEEYVRWTDVSGIAFVSFSMLGVILSILACGKLSLKLK